MAIQLAITNNKGVTANYHRIISVTQVYDRGAIGIHINLAGYVNKSYRDKENTPNVDGNYPESTVASNTPVYLPFVDGENFEIGSLYTRIKKEIADLSRSVDV